MRQLVDVFVPGHPKTKGSVDAMRRADGSTYVRQNVKGSVTWARLIEKAMRQAWQDRPKRQGIPIRAVLTYYLPVTPEQLLTQGSGDVDKLERNVLDAGKKAGIYHDDAQVIGVVHEKMCADAQRPQGVHIILFEVVTS